MKEALRIASKIIVALVFIFSGFVKCVDPLGTAYKFEDYFIALGWDFMIPLSFAFSVIMCATELLVGIMLLLNFRVVWGAWLALALMVFFTPLTLWLAVTNAVQDCGCFGDALILTNWQTFLKNNVLLIFVVILFINRKNFGQLISPKKQIVAAGVSLLLVLGFEWYNLTHLPVIDFMPYKVGNNIPEGMTVPEGAPQDQFDIILYYEKDGVNKKFTLEDYPRDDTTWRWVDTESILIKKGFEPPIHDFSIRSSGDEEQDITYEVLEDPNYVFLLISHNLQKAGRKNFDEINRIAEFAADKGYRFIALTGSAPEEYEVFREKMKTSFPFYNTDPITLKTMIRSNPGLMLMKSGTILGKWNHRHLPTIEELKEEIPGIRSDR